MVEYRARSPTEAPATSSSSRQEQSYAFSLGSLASQYGISDVMTSNDDNQPPQTIDEEYDAYISAPCSNRAWCRKGAGFWAFFRDIYTSCDINFEDIDPKTILDHNSVNS